MKNLKLENFGVTEMNQDEMLAVEGGGWLSRAWHNLTQALQDAYDWCKDTLGIKVGVDQEDYSR